MRTRKFLSLLLTMAMLVTTTGTTVFAQPNFTFDDEVVVDVVETTEEAVEEETTEETVVEETTEETVVEETTEETVVEETTEETVVEETTEGEFKFNGLPENYVLTADKLQEKSNLASYVSEISMAIDGVDYASQEVIVAVTSLEEAEMYAYAYNGTVKEFYEEDGFALITLPAEVNVQYALEAAAGMHGTVNLPAIWPNGIHRTFDEEVSTVSAVSGYNDKGIANQWMHEYVGSEYAWMSNYTGAGVKVAILDTGVLSTHEDLKANAVTGLNYGGTGNSPTNTTSDPNGHGTHVAGIVAADGNNGKGGVGIAPDAQIKGYDVFDGDGAYDSDIIRAINKATSEGYNVINMSLGGVVYNDLFQTACTNAKNAGVAVIVAAGNESTNTAVYPACYNNVITIGALDISGGAATFSNFGSHVDLAFPGVDIYSTYNGGNSSYAYLSGTSMASPVAAGVAAVILSANPSKLQGKTGAKKVDALESLMKSATKKSSSSGMGKGTTYLPKVLGISDAATKPVAPKFSQPKGTYYVKTLSVAITAEKGKTIYYSTNGKTPSFKNGVITNGTKYTGPVAITGAKNVTLKAIAVNVNGVSSKVASAKYTLQPNPEMVSLGTSTGYYKAALGSSLNMKATVSPTYSISTKVKWSVEPANQGVTINQSGKLTVSKTATAAKYTVTAQAVDKKGNPYSGVSRSTTIEVINQYSIKKIVAKKKVIDMAKTKENFWPTITPDSSIFEVVYNEGMNSGSYTLSSSDSKVATITGGGKVIQAQAAGTAKITATANDGSGKTATITVRVKETVTSIAVSGIAKVAKGKSVTLNATVTPATANNKKLDWFVEPANAGVTVSNGKVTAKSTASGTYAVYAKSKDGSEVTSNKFNVTVISGAITKITVPKNATIFNTKGSANAPTTYAINPVITGTTGFDKSMVSYTSSAPGVATVSNAGVVTAKAPGKTVITVKATDGSNKSAKITINVNVPMSKLQISPKGGCENLVAIGGKVSYGTLYYSEFGAPTNTKVNWVSSNPNVATVDSKGVVKGVANGTARITAVAQDGSKVSGYYDIKVVNKATSFSLDDVYNNMYYDYEAFEFVTNAGVISEKTTSNGGAKSSLLYKVDVKGPKDGAVIYEQYTNAVEILFLKKGTYTVTVTLLDGSNKKASCKHICTKNSSL